MQKKSIEFDIRVPNQTRYLSLIGRIGEDIAREYTKEGGVKDTLAHHLNIVLTEAMTNAIRHAHGDDPDKTVHISISIIDHELCIRVFDEGQGFDLNSIRAAGSGELGEHGRGIQIIRCIMDKVTYRKSRTCNVLEMWKKLK